MTDTPRPKSRDRERTRRAIIGAARQLLQERGLRFSLADVAHAAEVSKSGLLHHFSNRNVLLVAVVDDTITSFRQEVMNHTDIAENRAGKLLRGYVRALCGGSEDAIRTFSPSSAWAGVAEVPGVTDLLRADAEWWRAALARDGLPTARAATVRFAAEGVAAALATSVPYLSDHELTTTREALLELAEP
jgi:AcrR family transcriptional regulator